MDNARFHAMLKRCRRKQCPCGPASCELIRELVNEKNGIELKRQSIVEQLMKVNRPPATVRHDWKRPDKPDGDYRLAVHNDGDGWGLHWTSETEVDDYIEVSGDSAWPFVETSATDHDWECLGVEVI